MIIMVKVEGELAQEYEKLAEVSGSTPEQAVQQALEHWMETTGVGLIAIRSKSKAPKSR